MAISPGYRSYRRLALLLSCVVCACLLTVSGWASIAVSPMRVEARPTPGAGATTFYLTVSNTCNETPRTVHMRITDFWLAEDGSLQIGDDVDPDIANRYGGARYVTGAADSVTLGVGEERLVPFSVRLPSGATGSYGALITADAGHVPPSLQLGAPFTLRVSYEVSVFVLITAHSTYTGSVRAPSSPIRRELAVTDVYTELPQTSESRPMARVFATVHNTGSSHVSANITANLTTGDGNRILETVKLEGGTRLLLPGSRRLFYGDIRSALDPDLYRVAVQVVGQDGGLPATGSGQIELRTQVAGAPEPAPKWQLLSLDRPGILLTANAKRSGRRDVEVRNHLREPVTVEVQTPAGDNDWLTVSPKRFTLPALGVRSVRVRAARDARIPLGKHVHEVVLTPQPRGSDVPLDREAVRLQVVVISPKTGD